MSKKRSLLVAADIHEHKGMSRLEEVLRLVRDDPDVIQPDTVLMGGDYAGGGRPPRMGGRLDEWVPVFSLNDLKKDIRDILGSDVSVYLTYGSHDLNAVEGCGGFFSGPEDRGDYYLYGISFCQMRYAYSGQLEEMKYDGTDLDDPFGKCAVQAAEHFTRWERSLKDEKPVFVMSHMPLHAQRHDNLGAQIWCDALNRAAAKRPVYVFFAHNHHSEERPGAGPNYHFVQAGETMPVQQGTREAYADNSILFTYLNAGYILKGGAVLITIDGEQSFMQKPEISVRRFCADR